MTVGLVLVGSILSACGPQTVQPSASPGGATWPAVRASASVTYDPVRRNLFVFGGTADFRTEFNDTWTWDSKHWTEQHPPIRPATRQDGLVAFDASRRVVVLFGGRSKGVDRNDTWTWDGKNWTEQHPATTPPARGSAAMAYDPRSQTVLLVGGFTNHGNLSDMWSWNGVTWTELHPNRVPQLVGAAMADDGKRLVLFGGPTSQVKGRYLSQTWAWDGSNWSQLDPALNAPLDNAYSSAGDPRHGTVLFFGGTNGLIPRETWVWDGSRWARQHPIAAPVERSFAHLVYDATRNGVILYGGEGPGSGWLGDIWAWNGSNWSQIDAGPAVPAPSTTPGPRAVAMTAADAAATIRTALSTSHPILLPTWLPADLVEAQVTATGDGFNVYYLSDNRDKRVFLGLVVPNPAPGGPNQRSRQVRVLGVPAAYVVADSTIPLSGRYLEWTQPGTGPATTWLKSGGLPYFISADGLTDAEFWQVANSLKG
jgi:hypothetical protein